MSVPSSSPAGWQPVLPGVLRWRDSCNVYALIGPTGTVIVDAGTGAWIDAVGDLPAPPVALLCTHHFRDHSAGAARAARELGIPIHVPEREVALFRDAVEHHRGRQTFIVYANGWDHYAPIEDIPVAGVLRDHERIELGGLELEVVPLPGATVGQVGIAFPIRGGTERAICVGETIHSPGRVPRVAPFQWDYNGLPGAVEVWHAAADLRRRAPAALLPSMGEPILTAIDAALAALQDSMRALVGDMAMETAWIAEPRMALQRVSERVWVTRDTHSASLFVTGTSGRALAIDYGYHHWRVGMSQPAPHRRRSLLHTLDLLRDAAGVERVDVVIPSHYHDDHVAGIPLLQRLHGTSVWAHRSFAGLLADPASSAFPCTEPTALPIARVLEDDEPVTWDGVTFRFAAASGHTRFEHLIGWEVDGIRYAYSGDQYGFSSRDAFERMAYGEITDELIRDWSRVHVRGNHVYRGGTLLDSFARSAAWMRAWRPDIVASGHWPVGVTDDTFFERLDEQARRYAEVHRRAMPLDAADAHLDVDSWGGWLRPYRPHVMEGVPVRLRATIRNPLPGAARLTVRLVGPDGWTATPVGIDAPGRDEVEVDLEILPSGPVRRRPVALEVVADGRPLGQVAEALVTVGGPRW
ncbi:MAG: MBL fold metallo-hydrolase [Chloroflexota bacterium]